MAWNTQLDAAHDSELILRAGVKMPSPDAFHQAAVRVHQGPLPGAGEEHGAGLHLVRAEQSVDGAAGAGE